MHAEFHKSAGKLIVGSETFTCWSLVRNELNRRRELHREKEVVFSIPDHLPYMPRSFPSGKWEIVGVKTRTPNDSEYGYLGPYFIQTSAFQSVQVWALDALGGYDYPTDRKVIDTAYGFHHSRDSLTTLGCGRIATEKDVVRLKKLLDGVTLPIDLFVYD